MITYLFYMFDICFNIYYCIKSSLFGTNDTIEEYYYGTDNCDFKLNNKMIYTNELSTVNYTYGNEKYVYVTDIDTQFPIYEFDELETCPNIFYSSSFQLYDCDDNLIEFDDLREIIFPYAGPKGNFYKDKRQLDGKYNFPSEFDVLEKPFKLVITDIFGEVDTIIYN
jgi:hypothetical protein